MKDREFKVYLQGSLQQGAEVRIEKKRECAAECREIMRGQKGYAEEKRTGFWQFLSDVFRFEGLSILGMQAAVLLFVCVWMGSVNEISYYIPAFTPLFALAVMPVLLRSQYYKMGEMEAVTRASGTEIILAKLLLAGAANLVCITVVLWLALYLRQSDEGIGQMILYGLVPYLVTMTAFLRFIRLRRKERLLVCMAATVAFCVGWSVSAKVLPQFYETSATGLWIILFAVFAAFFGKEIYFIWEMRKEGKIYGIVD